MAQVTYNEASKIKPGDRIVYVCDYPPEDRARFRQLGDWDGALHLQAHRFVGVATLLPIPDDPRFQMMVESWPNFALHRHPRSDWLRIFEDLLRQFYPQASSRDLSLTARHAAPFYLAAGHDVP